MCSPKILLLVFSFAFIFFTSAHFHLAGLSLQLLAASISHFLTAALKFSAFFFQLNSSPFFLITRPPSFSVIHLSVDIKNNVEKDSTMFLFFSLKVRSVMRFPAKNTSLYLLTDLYRKYQNIP